MSHVGGLLVFIAVFLPSLIAALDALRIEAISRPATDMLSMFLAVVPHIIAAGLILAVTWLVGSFASRLLASLLQTLGFDTLPARVGLGHAFEGKSASGFIGKVALFFAMLFAVVEAANQLDSVILVIGFWLAGLAHEAIERAAGPNSCGLARFAILGLVVAMDLRAMGIADDIVNLAFGLTLGAIALDKMPLSKAERLFFGTSCTSLVKQRTRSPIKLRRTEVNRLSHPNLDRLTHARNREHK